jgi:hypothetical protein
LPDWPEGGVRLPAKTQQQQQQSNAALVAAATVILGAALMPSFALPALADLLGIMRGDILGLTALRIALSLLEEYPAPAMEGIGAAQTAIIRENELRRSAYTVTASSRLRLALADARAHGQDMPEAERTVREVERRYFQQHVQATAQRMHAATNIDDLALRYGPVLGWYAAKDRKVTAECKDADGKNFSALSPPAIGWPGIVHVNCRCQPGRPHRKGEMLP